MSSPYNSIHITYIALSLYYIQHKIRTSFTIEFPEKLYYDIK